MAKRVMAVILAALLVLSCAACGSGTAAAPAEKTDSAAAEKTDSAPSADSGETVTITWAINESANLTREKYTVVKDAFEAAHPNIKVELELFTAGEMDYLTRLAAGNMPDVIHMAESISMVDGALAEIPEELYSKWDDSALFTAKGKHNCVPVCGQGEGMCVIYHKDQFEKYGLEEPKTYKDFLKICDTFVENGVAPMVGFGAGDQDFFTGIWYFWNFLVNQEVNYDDFINEAKEGKAKWNDPGLVAAVKEFQTWNSNGYFAKGSESLDYTNAEAEFLKGMAPMMVDGVWALSGLDDAEYGTFMIPDPCGSKKYPEYMCYWGVSEQCKNKDAAFEFVDWVLTGDGLQIYTDQILANDAQVSLLPGAPTYEMDPLVKEYYDTMNNDLEVFNGEPSGDAALPTGFQGYVCTEFSKIYFENADVDTIMNEMQEEYERIIAEQ